MIKFLQARPYRFTGQDVLHGGASRRHPDYPQGGAVLPLLPIQGEVALSSPFMGRWRRRRRSGRAGVAGGSAGCGDPACIYPPSVDAAISIDRIREAAEVIDPLFLDTPQFVCEPLSGRIGVATLLKVESVNPIRSFKGRGTDYLLDRLGGDRRGIVCASAGNFGQGMAHACRKRARRLTVFGARTANPLKV